LSSLLKKKKKDSTSLGGEFKWSESTKIKDYGVKINGSLNNESDLKGDVETDFGSGFTFGVKGALITEPKEDNKSFTTGEIKYSHEKIRATGSVTYDKTYEANFSGVTNYESFTLGGSCKVNKPETITVPEYNVGIGYSCDGTNILFNVEKKKKERKLSFAAVQKINNNIDGGFQYINNLDKKKHEFTFGAAIKVDEDQQVKFKVNTEQKITLSYLVNLNKNLKANITLATSLDSFQGKPSTNDVSVGFTFNQ